MAMTGNVYANGELPVYSSTPSNADLLQSPVYISTYYCGANNENCDYFYMKVGSSYKFFFTAPNVYVYFYRTPNVVSFQPNVTYNGVNYNNFLNLTTLPEDNTFPYLGEFSTVNAGIDYYILNGVTYPNDTPPVYSSKKVDAGNVAILDFGSGVFNYDLTLTSYNYQKSGLFQGANVWNENGQAYYWSFTLPESGDSVSGTQITWDKAPSNLYPRDALGQTHYGISEMSGTGAARYLLIINPYVNQISSMGKGEVNGWINIDGIPEGVGVYIYPMQQTITGLTNENVISPTAENPGGYGVATSQGGVIDTTTIGGDAPYTQTTGGSNSSMPIATIGDYVEDINNTLSGFSQNFLNLLKAPIEYIKALVEGAQNFFQFIGGLFSWLPEEVGAFVITGLMVVVVVGVFHSLL